MALPSQTNLLVACLAAAAITAGYLYYQNEAQRQTIEELRGELSRARTTARLNPLPAGVESEQVHSSGGEIYLERKTVEIKRTPRYTDQTITCAMCKGEGKLKLRESRKQYSTYPCPVCAAQGTLVIHIPHDGEICPGCQGIGRIGQPAKYDETVTHSARICVPCNGKGWVKKRT